MGKKLITSLCLPLREGQAHSKNCLVGDMHGKKFQRMPLYAFLYITNS